MEINEERLGRELDRARAGGKAEAFYEVARAPSLGKVLDDMHWQNRGLEEEKKAKGIGQVPSAPEAADIPKVLAELLRLVRALKPSPEQEVLAMQNQTLLTQLSKLTEEYVVLEKSLSIALGKVAT